METHVQKWGNSLGLRIPSSLAKQLSLKDGNTVDIKIEKDYLTIHPKKYRLEDMLEKISKSNLHSEEISTSLKGREEW